MRLFISFVTLCDAAANAVFALYAEGETKATEISKIRYIYMLAQNTTKYELYNLAIFIHECRRGLLFSRFSLRVFTINCVSVKAMRLSGFTNCIS